MRQQSEKQKVTNKISELLSSDENDLVFSLLGRPCKSMCTAVVQLFTTEAPAHSIWIKRHTGVACFVRDNSKRSYFIRIYCLLRSELIWEEEMYDTIYINKSKDFLIDFEGRDCMVAINFASENEAANFHTIATATIANRNKRRATNKRRSRRTPPPTPIDTAQNIPDDNVFNNKVINAPIHSISQVPINQTNIPTANSKLKSGGIGGVSGGSGGFAKERKRTNRKFTKADISMPTDFKHLVHVGWTAQKGFDLNGEEVNSLNTFLEKAGVSEQQLKDRDTRAFIYDFIQSNNVLDSVKSEQNHSTKQSHHQQQQQQQQHQQHTPPPVPSRHHNGTQRTAPPPPPPPTRQPPPPVPKTTPPRTAPPGRPPPISISTSSSSTSAPPPPPPPMPLLTAQLADNIPMAPPPPPSSLSSSSAMLSGHDDFDTVKTMPTMNNNSTDARCALMDSIRKGTTLKKIPDPTTLSTGSGGGSDSRSDLLSEIRQGVELRSAANRELGTSSQRDTNGTDALADALRRALQERCRVLRSSDEDTDDSDDGEWDD